MIRFQAFDRARAVVSEVYCLHGEVVRIYSWRYANLEKIFDEYKSAPGKEKIQLGHFKQAINTFCRDYEFDKFDQLLASMVKDEEHLNAARTIIARNALQMEYQAKKMNAALHTKK